MASEASPDVHEDRGLRASTHERRDVVRVESSEIDLVDHASDQHVPPVVEWQLAAREDEHPQVRGVGEDFPEERKEGEHLRGRLVGVIEHDEAARSRQLAPEYVVDSAGLSTPEDGPETGSARGGEELGDRREDRLPGVPRSDAMPEQAPGSAQVVARLRRQVRLADARDPANHKNPRLASSRRHAPQLRVSADEPRDSWGVRESGAERYRLAGCGGEGGEVDDTRGHGLPGDLDP